jgi:tetratricopeptide (TPR) repeat protein
LDHLAAVAIWLGNLDEAVAKYSESLDLHRQLGGEWDIAHELGALGRAALFQADYAAAQVWLEEALSIQQQVGDKWDIAQSIRNLGDVALCQANYSGAVNYYAQSLDMYQDLGDRLRTAALCRNLGHALFFQEEYDAAAKMYRRAIALYRDMKQMPGRVLCLVGFAGILRIGGQLERSVSLLALVEKLCAALHIDIAPADRIQFAHNLEQARAMLDPELFSNAWAAGESMTMHEAASYLLQTYAHSS